MVDMNEVRRVTKCMKKTHPGIFREYHRLNSAKDRIKALELALKDANRELEAAQKAWTAVGEE